MKNPESDWDDTTVTTFAYKGVKAPTHERNSVGDTNNEQTNDRLTVTVCIRDLPSGAGNIDNSTDGGAARPAEAH